MVADKQIQNKYKYCREKITILSHYDNIETSIS